MSRPHHPSMYFGFVHQDVSYFSHFRGSNKTIVPSLGSLGKYLIDLKGSWMLFESSLTVIRELFFGGLWRSAFSLGSPQKDKSNKLTCQRNV